MQTKTEKIKEEISDPQTLKKGAVVAVYDNHQDAETAVRELERSGYDMKQLSIVGKDYETEDDIIGYYNSGDRMKAWGKRGAFWGGIWGMLFGWAFFVVPGIGPLLFAGPIVGWVLGAALEGAIVVGGLTALGAGLYGMGIPKDSVIQYETQIKAGKYLVISHGQPHEAAEVEGTLSNTKNLGIEAHPFVI